MAGRPPGLARTVALAPLHRLVRRCADPRVELELIDGGEHAGGSLREAGRVSGAWPRGLYAAGEGTQQACNVARLQSIALLHMVTGVLGSGIGLG